MSICELKCVKLLMLLLLLGIGHCLYEDQAGKFDWKRSYVGKVKFAKVDSKRVVVASEENVLACLSSKSGNILWRQMLENPLEHQIRLLHVENDVTTVSGDKNSFYVRGWDITSGTIRWEWTLYSEKISEDSYFSIVNRHLVHIVPIIGKSIEVTTYNVQTGENRGKTLKINISWATNLQNCILTGSYFVCILSDDSLGHINYVDVLSEKANTYTMSLEHLIGNVPGKVQLLPINHVSPAVLLLRNNVARLILLQDSPKALVHGFLPNVISLPNGNGNLLYQLDVNPQNLDKLLQVKIKSLDNGNEDVVEVEYPKGIGAPYIVSGQCKGNNCELLLSSSDNALSLLKLPEGNILWTREEALSNVIATEFFELPVSELDASIENEFKTSSGDIFSMLIHRLSTQTKQIANLLFGSQLLSSSMVRDDFGLHQIIVLATHVGKLFAIDTLTGATVWSYRLPQVVPFKSGQFEKTMLLFVQRTARYSPLPAVCTLLAKDAISHDTIMFQFDPITGFSREGIVKLNYKMKQALILPNGDDNHLKPFIIVDEENSVHVYPENAKHIVTEHDNLIYLYMVVNNVLQGYRLDLKNNYKVSLVWKVDFHNSKLVRLSVRPNGERVHSQGRVLPDRSVYYKYVNPNLIALATMTKDQVHKNVLSIYLIDGVTGLIVYSTSHKKAKDPVNLIHSENWLVYSYFSERFRRVEFAAAELYEGHVQNNLTTFSSHAVSQLPLIQTQSYILPAIPEVMTVTLTERGITSKCLLVALSNGAVTEIPWAVLQPRFADLSCGPEEICYPYMPEISLPSEATINYNQTLFQIKGIVVAPARLESTSHVLVYGLDMFYTRVAPSKTFDVLKEDFDYKLIVLVLAVLLLASYVTRNLASRKGLRQAWK